MIGAVIVRFFTQPGLAHVLLTSWALDFESRDYRFLAHKSSILPTLQSVVTLTNTASLASSGFDSLGSDTSAGVKEAATSKEGEASTTALEGWTPWSLENIREGFLQVILRKHDRSKTSHRQYSWGASMMPLTLMLAVSTGRRAAGWQMMRFSIGSCYFVSLFSRETGVGLTWFTFNPCIHIDWWL